MIEQLAEAVALAGVKEAFGVTGSGPTWNLITRLEQRGVRYFPAGHEGAGAIMAGAAGRAAGRLGVSLSIKGPGLANMAAGIAFNHFENLPTLSISEAYGENDPVSRMHKRMDQRTFVRPLVKGSFSLKQAARDFGSVTRLARSEVQGPVHIDLAETKECDQHTPPVQSSSDQEFEKARKLINEAKRPVVIAGSWALRQPWSSRLNDLTTPVFTTAAAKGLVDEASPFSAGIFTGAGQKLAPESIIIQRADLVIGLGLRNLEILTVRPFACKSLLVDGVRGSVMDGLDAGAHLIIDDRHAAELLLPLRHDWGRELIAECRVALETAHSSQDWLPVNCFRFLNSLTFNHGLVLDTGSFCTIGEHFWFASAVRPFYGSNNGRFMGGGIPSAIGAAIAAPKLPLFCAIGDGGMRMYPGELKLAVSENLPICFLLMRDGIYSSIAGATIHPMSRRAVELPLPSWAAAVEGMGCRSVIVNSIPDFQDAVQKWTRSEPLFVEAVFDPVPYMQMTKDLR